MAASLLFLVAPAALAYRLLGRAGFLRSGLARVFAAWFVGECAAVFAVYGVAVAFPPSATGVLRQASLLVLGLVCAALAVVEVGAIRARGRRVAAPSVAVKPHAIAGRAVFLAASLAFAILLYRPHLVETDDAILRTPIYWDISVHAPIVQNFVHGDNFPAGNESFAGAPLTYHFFFDLFTAIPAAFGLSLPGAFLLTSAASLFALFGLLAGFADELAGGTAPGMLAALFAATSSSLRFLHDVHAHGGVSLAAPFQDAAGRHPYLASFVPGNPFAYNGTMFNLFYFVEERQLVFASGFLLAAVLLLVASREKWSYPVCAGAGVLFGLFVFWHLFATAALGLAVVWLLAFGGERRKTAVVLAAMAAVGTGFLLWVATAMRPEWFLPGERAGLRWSFAFSTVPGGPPFSPLRALGYWLYAWGLKAIVGSAGLVLAYRRRRELFHALACVLVPAFVLVNAVQVLPLSVYDNHKWLRPLCLFLDLAAGYALVELVRSGRREAEGGRRRARWMRWALAAAAIPLLTFSGVVEGIPFFRSGATVLYARYPTRLTRDVRERTRPRDVFASFEANALHMAGRKLFVGNDADERGTASLVASAGFDLGRRQRAVFELYAATSRESFCGQAAEMGIDWLEVEPGVVRRSGADARAPGFDTVTPEGRPVRFLDVAGYCPLTPRAAPR